MASPAPRSFAFGVESELYLRPKDTAEMQRAVNQFQWRREDNRPNYQRDMLHQVLHALFLKEKIEAVLESGKTFDRWLICGDASLTRGEGEGYCMFSRDLYR